MSSDTFVVAGTRVNGLQTSAKTDRLVTVLVSCCGQLEYTRLCVPSLLRHSRQPFELIFLDCDSLDGTAEYLDGVAGAAPVRIEVVRVPAEPPLAPGRKEDHVSIGGDFVALVNNDTILPQGWLDRLIVVAGSAADVGLVAPMSNQAPAPFLVERVPYEIDAEGTDCQSVLQMESRKSSPWPEIDKVNRFARAWQADNHGQWFETDSAGGGCVLVKRDVLQKLGLFPSRTPLGAFDIEALAERVRQAGYRLAGSRDAYVHNFASRNMVRV
jgi:glycosyltransferase involved in cell wall biosynthesis